MDSATNVVERDRALLRAWRNGDRDSGDRLLAHYYRYFLSLCWQRGVVREDDQLDVFQEVVVRLMKVLPGLRLQTSFAGYLRLVVRTAIRSCRARWPEAVAEDLDIAVEAPAAAVEQREILLAIDDCSQLLDEREGHVFQMRMHEEKSFAELGSELGVSVGNLHVIYHRARQKLRQCLERKGFPVS
ncbi:MAG: sigma-70 family RNA polymerase sigma factor [Planctomycetota bacterium]